MVKRARIVVKNSDLKSYWRIMNTIRKILPGTMGGESRIATPAHPNSSPIPWQTASDSGGS